MSQYDNAEDEVCCCVRKFSSAPKNSLLPYCTEKILYFEDKDELMCYVTKKSHLNICSRAHRTHASRLDN